VRGDHLAGHHALHRALRLQPGQRRLGRRHPFAPLASGEALRQAERFDDLPQQLVRQRQVAAARQRQRVRRSQPPPASPHRHRHAHRPSRQSL
jgi:hypothetical protein